MRVEVQIARNGTIKGQCGGPACIVARYAASNPSEPAFLSSEPFALIKIEAASSQPAEPSEIFKLASEGLGRIEIPRPLGLPPRPSRNR